MKTILVVALALSCPLAAQIESNPLKERLRKEILEKQKMMREGRVIRSNVRVTVRLDNGSRIKGVVKGGRVIEKVDGLEFVPADMASPDAGLRLWYYNDTNSYIFIPFSTIKHHNIGEKLTDAEIVKIEERIDEAKKRSDERRKLLAMQRQQKQDKGEDPGLDPAGVSDATPAKPGGASKKEEEDSKKPGMDPALAKLLEEFPPEDGWGKEKYDEIQKRKIVVGVYPDQKSARFLEVFEEWSRAYELSKVLNQQPAPPSLGGTPKKKN
ncbi:MAG: hypothetical protein ACYTG5_05345 [Planctomycetota bacterium]